MNAYTNISTSPSNASPASAGYDPNGNMLSGPVGNAAATLSYDNEHARRLAGRAEFAEQNPERGDFPILGENHQNRLRTITQNGTTAGYTYDALGRLIQTYTTAATNNRERYTWSGWTLLNREIFTGTTPTTSFRYTWGLDLSESLEGAGGVGGLLAIERNKPSSSTWDIRFPHYDANGNIIALTDNTGNISARYRYDAFGKVLSTTDLDSSNWVSHNIHNFSTKPTFGTPDLLYYGYRFYTPSTGRWLNRDPIEESGGMNLYEFVGNDRVGKWDLFGLAVRYAGATIVHNESSFDASVEGDVARFTFYSLSTGNIIMTRYPKSQTRQDYWTAFRPSSTTSVVLDAVIHTNNLPSGKSTPADSDEVIISFIDVDRIVSTTAPAGEFDDCDCKTKVTMPFTVSGRQGRNVTIKNCKKVPGGVYFDMWL